MAPLPGNIPIDKLTSPANDRIKQLVRLRERSAERLATDLFTIETPRELSRAIANNYTLAAIFTTPDAWAMLQSDPDVWAAVLSSQAERFEITPELMRKASYRLSERGFIAVLQARSHELNNLTIDPAGLYLICNGLEKPGNIGAILRTADACAVSGVLIDRPNADLYNPNIIRSSTGTVFSQPIAAGDEAAIIQTLKSHGIRILAMSDEADRRYTHADWTRGAAIVLGSEADGLTDSWRDAADEVLSIPMRGTADSLNVAVTASVVVYEATRQRDSRRDISP